MGFPVRRAQCPCARAFFSSALASDGLVSAALPSRLVEGSVAWVCLSRPPRPRFDVPVASLLALAPASVLLPPAPAFESAPVVDTPAWAEPPTLVPVPVGETWAKVGRASTLAAAKAANRIVRMRWLQRVVWYPTLGRSARAHSEPAWCRLSGRTDG